MKECKDEAILPCYRDGYGIWHHLDDTHEKVFGLNKQMCDIGKALSDPMESLSEDTERAMLGCCELLAKDASDAELMMDDIVRRAEENIRRYNDNNKYARLIRKAYECKFGKPKEKDIMEEKKTKTMTKAEAFEYFKKKRVVCDNFNSVAIQRKFFEAGIKWRGGSTEATDDRGSFMFVDLNGCLTHCNSREWFDTHEYEEISADDILSIEIVDEKECSEEDGLDLISTVGARLSEVLRRMEGHKHIVITEDDVILYDEGMSFVHSDPF